MRELERRQTSLQRNVSPDPRTFRRNWADWYNNIRANANRMVRGATTSVSTFRGRSRSNMLSQLGWRLLPRVKYHAARYVSTTSKCAKRTTCVSQERSSPVSLGSSFLVL